MSLNIVATFVVSGFVTAGAGPYALTPVTLGPPPDGDPIRAIWLYSGTKFDSDTESQAVLDFCAREGVNRIYCGAYAVWANGTSTQKANLRTFLQTAHASGIRMEALCGDKDWQYDAAKVRSKIDQILALHTATPTNPDDDFDAVHFDVEFWIDATWTAAGTEAGRQQIARDYLDNVLVNARNHLDASGESDMEVAVDLSAHFNSASYLPSPMLYNGTTQYFVEHVLDLANDLVFMSYYDSASSLLNTTSHELDWASGKGRRVQLGANIQPGTGINTFADNAPTPFSAMTTVLEQYHTLLSAPRLAALDGFSVFHYDGYLANEPNPHNWADLDGDGDADLADYTRFAPYVSGPAGPASGLARDGDLTGNGTVALDDFSRFCECFTGAGVTGPIPQVCER